MTDKMSVADALAVVAAVVNKKHQYCPICAGWDSVKEKNKLGVHNDECGLVLALATLTAATSGGVDDAMVERAITAAMKRCREEGVGLCDKRWDTLFPSRAAWRAALTAALKDAP